MSKAKNQVIHAKRRAFERYGLTLNRDSYGEMVKIIQSGKATCINKLSNRTKTFYVPFQGKVYKVAYDNKSHKIVTFLKEEWIGKGKPVYSSIYSNEKVSFKNTIL